MSVQASGALSIANGGAQHANVTTSLLYAQGNPVTLDVMPDSSHAWLRGADWDVFLAAFPKAGAGD